MMRQESAFQILSRTYLETFTLEELCTAARSLPCDIDLARKDRCLLISEILDTIDEGLGGAADFMTAAHGRLPQKKILEDAVFPEVKIPSRYNATYINAIVRDGVWVFVFWEIKETLAAQFKAQRKFQNFSLRLNAVEKGTAQPVYSTPIAESDNAWYLKMPKESSIFFAEICACLEEKEEPLAKSNVFFSPKAGGTEIEIKKESKEHDALLALSGIEELW